ncbi:hypothetical protein C2845_PM07G33980 [Panicum miliaceum]|uniref:AB hydrolase-1 domain-containing protein n=1 Tax=Panicum miliaceum TaxID=4540 RepID=A0A3L6SSS6_PANMI|nr:hypothetical protein C2845_PM07G33980 [Panicum miliaceum]
MEENNGRKLRHHFVLVHGLCHGAWCWYKVATVLESAGHRVTALDLPRCGASAVRAEEVRSFEEYSRPLLRAVAAAPPGEKVVLVGHSFGGHNLALAMQAHPEKVAVAIFVSAPMPVAGRPMSAVLEQDLTLARMLVRPAQMFFGDEAMTGEKVLTEGRYGAVSRVFVVAEEDKTWPAEEQRRVAASCGPGVEVRTIGGADHMPMFSKPAELAQLIMEVAEKDHGERQEAASAPPLRAGPRRLPRRVELAKVATALSSAGHRVTALDMAACGARPGRAEEVPSFEEYSRPLLDAVAAMPAAGKPMTLVSQQDLTLAMAAVRPSRQFPNDATMMDGAVLTAERYGAVRQVCIVAEEDASWSAEFQRRMASWNAGTEVRGLQGADHMPMLSKPRELSELLMEVADKYS